jgi:hypothetical protein
MVVLMKDLSLWEEVRARMAYMRSIVSWLAVEALVVSGCMTGRPEM